MRRLIVALGLSSLFLAILASAQSQPAATQLKIRRLTLNGAPRLSQADRDAIAREIEKMDLPITSASDVSERLLYTLQERGFFKVSAPPPQVTVVSSNPAQEVIDLVYDVNEGQQYRLKQITFSNVDPAKGYAFPTDQLRQAFPIAPGEIFNTDKIRTGLEKLRELYASNGYINFTPVPNVEADDASGTITLRVDVDEGAVFRVGSLVLDGVEPEPGAGAKLLAAWKHYEGRVYDGRMMAEFIRENLAYLPPHPKEEQIFEVRQDPFLKVVNFRLELDRPDGR